MTVSKRKKPEIAGPFSGRTAGALAVAETASTLPEMPAEQKVSEENYEAIAGNMLDIVAAQRQLQRSIKLLRKNNAEQYLIDALVAADRELSEVHTRMMQRTYFAGPDISASALF